MLIIKKLIGVITVFQVLKMFDGDAWRKKRIITWIYPFFIKNGHKNIANSIALGFFRMN